MGGRPERPYTRAEDIKQVARAVPEQWQVHAWGGFYFGQPTSEGGAL